MLSHFVLMAGLLIAPVGVEDVQPDDAELKASVRRHIRDLQADERETRDQAEQQLLKLGTPALKHLPIPNFRMSAELRERIGRIRKSLEKLQARAATTASLVTLNAQEMPLAEVLEAIHRQTGNRVIDSRVDKEELKITLELEKAPFWKTLDAVLAQTKLSIDPYAEGDDGEPLTAVALVDRSDRPGEALSYSGSFRFEATAVSARRGLRHPESSGLNIDLELLWEPRMKPITLTLNQSSVLAIDQQGNKIAPGRQGETMIDVNAGASRFGVQLKLPPRESQILKSVSGELSALLPGRIETFRFDRLAGAKDIVQKKGGVTVHLQQVRKNGEAWELQVVIRFENPGGAFQSHLQSWVMENVAYLEGPDKKKVEQALAENFADQPGEFGVRYFFAPEAGIDQFTFVYKTPAALVHRKVEFKFKDLKLP